jgi:hypothetical protein
MPTSLTHPRLRRDRLEGRSAGSDGLPGAERRRGQEHARKPAAGSRCLGQRVRGTRAVWRRLDCLNPNLQRQHFTATGKASETGVRRGRGVLVRPGQPSRRERCPTRAFKEMSGAPAAAFFVCQRRTWDHRPSTAGGVGVLVVVAGVTTGRGERESRSQGEGAQVMRTLGNGGGMRNAER